MNQWGGKEEDVLLILGMILIAAGVVSTDWATSDDLTLQYHGWPQALRGNRPHRRFFLLLGIVLVVAGVIPFFSSSLEVGTSVIVILLGFFFLGVLQILPLIVFRTLERLCQIFRR